MKHYQHWMEIVRLYVLNITLILKSKQGKKQFQTACEEILPSWRQLSSSNGFYSRLVIHVNWD